MLLKSRISQINMFDDKNNHSYAWKLARVGNFTSSNIHKLMGENGLGDTGMKYIRTRVFEALSGVSSEEEFTSASVAHGAIYEIEAIRKFQQKMQFEVVALQKLIHSDNPKYTSTPDALVIRKESLDELYYDCSTVETKCFQAEKHMEMCEAETPQDIKRIDRKIYFQVLDQLTVCDCLNGYAVFYHPDLPIDNGGLHIVEFRKMQAVTDKDRKITYPINDDITLLRARKELALNKFNDLHSKMLNKKGQPLPVSL